MKIRNDSCSYCLDFVRALAKLVTRRGGMIRSETHVETTYPLDVIRKRKD